MPGLMQIRRAGFASCITSSPAHAGLFSLPDLQTSRAGANVTVQANVDQEELRKFSALAHRWWDPSSEFKPLHVINPIRLAWIESLVGGLQGKRILDVGCGGGILAESMALRGATVTGIDLAEKSLAVARLHALETGTQLDYRAISAEDLAEQAPGTFDLVTCMEMLEHVPEPASVVNACSKLVKPGGTVVFSTINRNPKSYVMAILGAEYILGLLPKGTHDYQRLITPAELARMARVSGLSMQVVRGMAYNPFSHQAKLNDDASVNYLMHCIRPAE
jgi:2-polyprenyl-6-hydroxyphenyl methylase/3-demethylubiquinone-9 3-methyltransferase